MKNLSRIATLLYCEPWAISPQVYGQLTTQFEAHIARGINPDQADADDPVGPIVVDGWTGRATRLHPQVEKLDGIALVRGHGIIGKHISNLEMRCGGYDIGLLTEQLQNIEDDEDTHTVVIDFRTPGGTVIGVETCALAIRKVSDSGKRVIGYTDTACASAGYWLASACDEFYAEGSAQVGSISTFCGGVDSSKQWKKEGKKLMLFRTGDLKAIGLPGKEWTEKEIAFMQEKAESVDKDMKDFIRSRRGLTDEQMQGNYWYAKHAPAGLVDGIIPRLQDLLQVLME